MVDSEESGAGQRVVSIAEDNEYFERMWNLVPPLVTAELEPEGKLKAEEVAKAEAKMKKKAKKEKKREKHRKKESSVNSDTKPEEDVQKPTKKHERDVDDTEYTSLKPKKQKVNHIEEPLTVNHTAATDTSDSDVSSEPDDSTTKPNTVSVQVQNIPVKGKKKPIGQKSLHKQREQCSKVTSTVSNTEAGPSTSCVALTNDLSKGDILQAASINSIEDKREKLRVKIAELQAKRKPSNKERLEKKKLKRQESKMKLKQKRKLEKLQKKQNKQSGEGSKPTKGNLNKGANTPVKPVYNNEGQMVFSKFDFTDSAKKEKRHNDLGGKDYKRLLEKIEKRNEKINKVKSKDESAGKALEEKFKWESALHKAEGEKVKDNPELLKKALKRKEKLKDQKKKKWDKRVEHVEKTKDEKQKKRNENIQKRKQNMKDKKLKKLKKKGRILPGF